MFWTPDPSKPFAGPFDTEKELSDAILQKHLAAGRSKHKVDYYRQVLDENFQNHKPTFSHGDFQKKNIIIRQPQGLNAHLQQSNPREMELVIIDWEYAAWYPDYWEYAHAMFACGMWNDDWSAYVQQILDPYLIQFPWLEKIFLDLWS
jgi:thiamine kinase-like enzyme